MLSMKNVWVAVARLILGAGPRVSCQVPSAPTSILDPHLLVLLHCWLPLGHNTLCAAPWPFQFDTSEGSLLACTELQPCSLDSETLWRWYEAVQCHEHKSWSEVQRWKCRDGRDCSGSGARGAPGEHRAGGPRQLYSTSCTLLWTLDPETAARHSFPRSGFCRIVPRSCHTE